tara:strand:- start:757 stop:1251 length:495 start_codon:yes stop_codon:yes gene_type:complete
VPGTGIFGLEPLEKRLLLSATLGADLADAWTAEPTPIAAILEETVPEGPQAALPDHQPAIDLFDNLPTLFEAGPQPATPTVQLTPGDSLFAQQWHLDSFQNIEVFAFGGASDRLAGPNGVNDWQITGINEGTLNGSFTFSGVENLTGGTATGTGGIANIETVVP